VVLQQVFGYPRFRGPQEAIVRHVVGGGSALVLMPTGGGKSLCYQVPALCMPGLTVVVSPLIALMQDQVAALQQAGVAAEGLHSALDPQQAGHVWSQLQRQELKLLYVSPERLLAGDLLEQLGSRVSLFAIDEAHCVSQWGHDFRPEYRQLDQLAQRFPAVPRLALTATADPRTREDIRERLGLQADQVFLASFDRPNIRYLLRSKQQPREQLLTFLEEQRGSAGIVYARSRSRVDQLTAVLREAGFPAVAYHAGLDPDVRRQALEAFRLGSDVVVVATIAFGMGIDKPDVRFVAHVDLPKSLEAYYQETGRAGRDGLPAVAWMVHGPGDIPQLRRFIDDSVAAPEQKRIEHGKLEALIAYSEAAGCRRQVLLRHFGETLAEPCGNCDGCLEPQRRQDCRVAVQKVLSTVFRTGQRYSLVILAIVLLYAAQRMTAWQKAAASHAGPGGVSLGGLAAAAAICGLVLWDQVPRAPAAEVTAAIARQVAADREFTAKMEAVLPKGAMVFQLPVMDFPESPQPGIPSYDHFRPYLYSSNLRYSFGSMKGREREKWQAAVQGKFFEAATLDREAGMIRVNQANARAAVDELKRLGFAAIYINRNGFPDRGKGIEEALLDMGYAKPPIRNATGDLACIVLEK